MGKRGDKSKVTQHHDEKKYITIVPQE